MVPWPEVTLLIMELFSEIDKPPEHCVACIHHTQTVLFVFIFIHLFGKVTDNVI